MKLILIKHVGLTLCLNGNTRYFFIITNDVGIYLFISLNVRKSYHIEMNMHSGLDTNI